MRPTATQALLSGIGSLAMTVPLNRFLVLVAAALTLLAVMLATTYAIYAQSGDYSCAAGEAVADPDKNPELVSDCTALLAARDNLTEGSGLDWSVDIPMSEWDGVTLSEPDDDATESHTAPGYRVGPGI